MLSAIVPILCSSNYYVYLIIIYNYDIYLCFLEQKRLVANYNREACAVQRQLASNWTCDVAATPPRLEIPMLPCNFIPIQPQLYTSKLYIIIHTLYTCIYTSSSSSVLFVFPRLHGPDNYIGLYITHEEHKECTKHNTASK